MRKTWHKAAIFNKQTFSRVFGMQMAGMAMALSIVTYPTHAFDYNLTTEGQRESQDLVVTTSTQYQFPVSQTLGMSQGYHALHAGIDLRAPRGTAILAMDGGVVIEVEKMLVGYGHFVRIAHQGTLSTLYAHLDQVCVKPGEKVERGQQIGTVGMSGWSTGPHLHFEVYDGNKAMNPTAYIGVNSK